MAIIPVLIYTIAIIGLLESSKEIRYTKTTPDQIKRSDKPATRSNYLESQKTDRIYYSPNIWYDNTKKVMCYRDQEKRIKCYNKSTDAVEYQ